MKKKTIKELNEKILNTPSAQAGFVSTYVYYDATFPSPKKTVHLSVTIKKGDGESSIFLLDSFKLNPVKKKEATKDILEFYSFAENLINLLHN